MPEAKDARRLIPDPENEPDLYAISRAFPLPGDDPSDIVPPESAFVGKEASGPKEIQAVDSTGVARLASEVEWMADRISEPPSKIKLVSNNHIPVATPVPSLMSTTSAVEQVESLLVLKALREQQHKEAAASLLANNYALLKTAAALQSNRNISNGLQSGLFAGHHAQSTVPENPRQIGSLDGATSAALAAYLRAQNYYAPSGNF